MKLKQLNISTLFIALLSIGSITCKANIDLIDSNIVNVDKKYSQEIKWIYDNTEYYLSWNPDWKHDVEKEEILNQLIKIEKTLAKACKKDKKNIELALFVGDVNTFLHNLDAKGAFTNGIKYYNLAHKINNQDIRPLWFSGVFQCNGAQIKDGLTALFSMLENFPEDQLPATFWSDFAYCSYMGAMKNHSIWALDKYESITGEPCEFDKILGSVVRGKVRSVSPSDSISWNNSLSARGFDTDTIVVTSNLFGAQFRVDSNWSIQPYDYKSKNQAIIFKPLGEKNKEGEDITYTLVSILRVPEPDLSLKDFISSFIPDYENAKPIKIESITKEYIAYEIIDPNLYEHIGGAHHNIIAIKLDEPKASGLAFEKPSDMPKNTGTEEMQYFNISDSYKRFNGTLYMLLMLDTCEDIYDKSKQKFDQFIRDIELE